MPNLQRKFILIGIISILAMALTVAIAVPALATSPFAASPGKTPSAIIMPNNFASVQGSLTVASNVVTVTPNATPLTALIVTPGQTATILYNKTTGAVQGLMLDKSGQSPPTSKNPPDNFFAMVQGVPTVTNNIITITLNTTPSPALTVLPGQIVTILYNKTTGTIQELALTGPVKTPPIPKNPFAMVQGIPTIAGNVITVTPNATPLTALIVTPGQTVTIVYNKTTGAVQGLMLDRSGHPLPAPKNLPKSKFATVQGTPAVANNIITITLNTALSPALTLVSGQTVTIIYNKTTGAIQGLMLGKSGHPLPPPMKLPRGKVPNWQGHGPCGPISPPGHPPIPPAGNHISRF